MIDSRGFFAGPTLVDMTLGERLETLLLKVLGPADVGHGGGTAGEPYGTPRDDGDASDR